MKKAFRLEDVVIVLGILIGLVYLTYSEFGSYGIRILLISLGIFGICGIVFGVFYLGQWTALRQVSAGAELVTRHDSVDAVGDAIRLKALGQMRTPSIPKESIKVIQETTGETLPRVPEIPSFEVLPFRLPDKTQK